MGTPARVKQSPKMTGTFALPLADYGSLAPEVTITLAGCLNGAGYNDMLTAIDEPRTTIIASRPRVNAGIGIQLFTLC